MVLLRLGCVTDISRIKMIADANKQTLGFTVRAILLDAIAQKELHVVLVEETLAGFIRWHKRKDGWITVYEIAVDALFRRRGVGSILMQVTLNSPVRLKCHSRNPAVYFYYCLGFRTARTELSRGGKQLDVLMRESFIATQYLEKECVS